MRMRSFPAKIALLVGILLASILLALHLGKYPIPFIQLWQSLFCADCTTAQIDTVIWQIRLPRIFVACIVGAALACAGSAYQGMFKNPLVSPDILGVSAGAGFGASLAIFYDLSLLYVQLFAFFGGLCAVLVVSLIASRNRQRDPLLVLVLAGVAVGTLLGSGISLLKILADPFTQLQSITFWLLGSLTAITMQDAWQLFGLISLGIVPLFLLRWRLNLLSLDEDEAQTLGLSVKRTRYLLIIFTTLCTASAVSVTGIIGWVGLVVPHIARLLVGANFIILLPTSLLLGASFLLITDTLARTVAEIEIPLGILTSLCGAPFFLYLLLRSKK